MKYMGSKARIAKHILPIILKDRQPDQWYIEPFCGGMNCIDKVDGNRIASDTNHFLVEMWRKLINGAWVPPDYISRETHNKVKTNQDGHYPELVGWVGFCCSYCGVWFGGFSGKTKTKIGTTRNYQDEARRNVLKQVPKLQGVVLKCSTYSDLDIPDNSIIYCDPPYENVSGYKDKFDHTMFWSWCREQATKGHAVFVSEYNAPDDFVCVWQQEVKSSLSANGKAGASKNSVEKLFILK